MADRPSPSTNAGLSQQEAQARLERDGPNELSQAQGRNLLHIALEVAKEPMFQLLVAAGLIYLALGDLGEALMLLAFVTITIGITIFQERRSEKVLETLRDLTSPRATVIRDGLRQQVAGRDLVLGDLIALTEGERIPADAVLLSANDLMTDESLLTGESASVSKVVQTANVPAARPGGDNLPFVYSGSMVVRGQGLAEVTATGARSEIGKIGSALAKIKDEATPLNQQMRRLVRIFSVLGLTLSVIVVLLFGLTRGHWLNGVLAGITLAMSMLPQEFLLILTVFMVMGSWRLSQHRVLARRSATIETLGAATVLCTDKTGTLTANRMSIAQLEADGHVWTSDQADLPEEVHRLMEYGILASEVDPFDPMEVAFVELGQQHLRDTEHLHATWMLAYEYGLSPDMLAMSHLWKAADQASHIIAAKGAPEAIADLCHLPAEQLAKVRQSAEAMAARGMRVLGVAKAHFEGSEWPGQQHDFDFEFLGLVGLADPLRPSVQAAIRECRTAGIKVAMITGDYPATALAIAAQAGIDTSGGVLKGDELQTLSDEQLRERLATTRVFARIMPEQKLRIVNAYKANGDVVAMTGDGVNDAPSLKAAHIGIAMGGRGTDVAREASGIILMDDDFASIVRAVRLGRRIYDNLRKAITFVLAVHIPIAGLSLVPLLFGWPLIFYPVHIAFLELVIDPVCSIVFEAEPAERSVMQRPPRAADSPLLSFKLLLWSVFQGGTVLLAVGGFFILLLNRGLPQDQARAASFVALVVANFGLIIVNRAFDASLISALARPNRALWRMLAATIALLAAALWIPVLRTIFNFGAISGDLLAGAIGLGFGVLLALELVKKMGAGKALAPST